MMVLDVSFAETYYYLNSRILHIVPIKSIVEEIYLFIVNTVDSIFDLAYIFCATKEKLTSGNCPEVVSVWHMLFME